MGSKNEPGKFDCYANAAPDEPMFILLARDACAPAAVEKWIELREGLIKLGIKPESDRAMLEEARQCVANMVAWRDENRPATPDPKSLPEGYEMYEGKPMKVLDGARFGWWRFHKHYDRDGYCDNPARGY